MSGIKTKRSFMELVALSGLLKPTVLDRYRQFPENELAERMLADGELTPFQAKQLLDGRHRGFILGDKYKILDLLGRGGMSRVVICEHMQLGRLVAIKLMDPALEKVPGAAEQFLLEARALATIDHPNLARIHDFDRSQHGTFMVMEYVDGVNLKDLTLQQPPFCPGQVAGFLRQAALGLHQTHLAKLVHRDIKPSNLMLDRNGCIKILDLGLARFVDAHRFEGLATPFDPNSILGTADFIAPEQARDSGSVDIRADIYSLGCTAYFLMLKKLPADVDGIREKLKWHQTQLAPALRLVRPEIPEGLATIVEKMMAKDPAHRFQTPAEVYEALTPFFQNSLSPDAAVCIPASGVARYRTGTFNSISAGSFAQCAETTSINTSCSTQANFPNTRPPQKTGTCNCSDFNSRTEGIQNSVANRRIESLS